MGSFQRQENLRRPGVRVGMAYLIHCIFAGAALLETSVGYYKWNQKRKDVDKCDEKCYQRFWSNIGFTPAERRDEKKGTEVKKWEYNLLRITGGPPGDHPLMVEKITNQEN